MKIIAFGYKKNTGKSTAAKFLTTYLKCEHPELVIKQVSFAAKLKDIAYQLYSWAGLKKGIFYESHYAKKEIILPRLGLSPREIWIGIGNKLREVYPNTWIDYALNIKADFIIISDLRFRNEAQAISNKDGILVRIDRIVEKGTDPAEIDLDSWKIWDEIISNNSSLSRLNERVLSLIK